MADLPERRQHERDLVAALLTLFASQAQRVLEHPGQIPWGRFEQEISQALQPTLATSFMAAAENLAIANGVSISPADAASDYSAKVAGALAPEINRRSRQVVDDARQKASDYDAFAAAVLVAYGSGRATRIAVSEVARAISQGQQLATLQYEALTGEVLVPIWHTEQDGRVCEVCAPLHGQDWEVWRAQFPSGPPAHPNCRCWLVWRRA
jgi:hypothetical protein